MSFRINTNVAAMNAHQSGVITNRNLANSLEKLSSGLRINKAADDASGMAIADSLRTQANALGQAVRNANDAIGVIQTADKAMDEQIKILDLVKTKATQAAQDGQTMHTRKMIQADINRLLEELDNIANSTSFNGRKLLSGAFVNKEFQIGAYSNETIKVTIGATNSNRVGSVRYETGDRVTKNSEVELKFLGVNGGRDISLERVTISTGAGTGLGVLVQNINKNSDQTGIRATATVISTTNRMVAQGSMKELVINGVEIGTIDGIKDGDKDGRVQNAVNTVTDRTGVEAYTDAQGRLHLRSMDGRGIKVETKDDMSVVSPEVIKAGDVENLNINGILIGSIKNVEDGDKSGKLVNFINDRTDETGVVASVVDGKLVLDGVHAKKDVKLNSFGEVNAGTVEDLEINGVPIGTITGVQSNDSDGKLVNAINAKSAQTGVTATISGGVITLEGLKDPATGEYINPDMQIKAYSEGLTFDYREKSKYENPEQTIYVTAKSGPMISNQSFNKITSSDENYGRLTLSKLTARDILVSGVGDLAGFSSTVSQDTINLRNIIGPFTKDVASAIGTNANSIIAEENKEGIGTGVTSLKGAMLVMDIAEAAIKELDKIRADLGSVQQQLIATINNVSVTQVNVKAAESQIRDVDFASESANFTKNNILAQSGNYAMTQANATQQNVLKLLQ